MERAAPKFRGHKSSAVEAALIETLAGELKRRNSSIRIARAPDGDRVYDFVIVDAKDAAKAILEGYLCVSTSAEEVAHPARPFNETSAPTLPPS